MRDQTFQKPLSIPATNDQQQTDNVAQELTNAVEQTKEQIKQNPTFAQELGATPTLQNEVVDIERELLDEIIKRLDQNRMSEEEAQQLAGEFLELLPLKDKKDLLDKLRILSKTNPAAKGIYIEYVKPHEANETQRKLQLMSQHLHEGKIEEALSVAKGGTNG